MSDSGGGSLETAIIGCADLTGFSEWLIADKNPISKFQPIYRIFRLFSKFSSKEYYTKLLGDGLLYIRIIKPHEFKNKSEIIDRFLTDTHSLLQEVKLTLESKVELRSLGIRARVASGLVSRLYMDPPHAHDDFIGYPINFAARLLGVLPRHELICSAEVARESKNNPLIRFVQITETELMDCIQNPPKGIIQEDLKQIYRISITPLESSTVI